MVSYVKARRYRPGKSRKFSFHCFCLAVANIGICKMVTFKVRQKLSLKSFLARVAFFKVRIKYFEVIKMSRKFRSSSKFLSGKRK